MIFCAVPAISRVEPAIGSEPVSSQIGQSASGSGVHIVCADGERAGAFASRKHATVNGVVPLAATAIKTSLGRPCSRTAEFLIGLIPAPDRLQMPGHHQP